MNTDGHGYMRAIATGLKIWLRAVMRTLIRVYPCSSVVPILLLFAVSAHADPASDEARAQHLFTEVRCVQCQSQDIADSDAQIAGDMRREIRDSIKAGQSDEQIRKTLYDHYGDYVLFRPRLSAGNLILWLLPPLIVLLGIGAFVITAKKQAKSKSYDLDAAEQKKLREIMKNRD